MGVRFIQVSDGQSESA